MKVEATIKVYSRPIDVQTITLPGDYPIRQGDRYKEAMYHIIQNSNGHNIVPRIKEHVLTTASEYEDLRQQMAGKIKPFGRIAVFLQRNGELLILSNARLINKCASHKEFMHALQNIDFDRLARICEFKGTLRRIVIGYVEFQEIRRR